MRIVVVGAGAVGQFYGAQLILAGHALRFVARRDLERLRTSGLRVVQSPTPQVASTLRAAELRIAPADFLATDDPAAAAAGGADWCLLATKAGALPEAERLCGPAMAAGARLATLINGLGVEEQLSRWCPPERLFGVLCFVCINRDDDGTVRHLAHGRVGVGHWRDEAAARRELAALWRSAGIEASEPSCLREARWRKLAWNVPFNGLSVAGGLPGRGTQAILADPALRARAERLMREVIRIGNADLAAHGHAARIDEEAWVAEQFRLTEEMGDYLTSTLLDLRAGRPLELETLFLEPWRRAQRLGCAATELACLITELPALPPARGGGA
ncbi:MAG: 2-dehydropantoate 2-reductase [Planctomycetota bacterium]|nr:2-dehydropantoate 2-reductase [Planctomycetota bacterium]